MKQSIKENSKNYACSVVKIEHLYPIENADKIQKTIVNGNSVVVSMDVKLGDIMLYFVSGTKLNKEYCTKNNLLDKQELNDDVSKRGFISHKQFRVKAIKIRGIISDGMLMPLNSLLPFLKENEINYIKVGDEFTDINGFSLCEKYFVTINNSNIGGKAPKPVNIFNRLVDNQFYLHGDTDNLRKNMHKIDVNSIVGIHYKKHGSSFVVGNVLTLRPLKWYEKILKLFGVKVDDKVYDIIYSSRKVIKNSNINPNTGNGFYGEDIWGVVAKEIGHLIPKNYTLYGEIVGYTPSGSYIQNSYDYGCTIGEHKVYIYKISVVNPDGKVIYLTDNQILEFCEERGLRFKETFLYYGFINGIFDSMSFTEWDVKYREEEYNGWEETLLHYLEWKYNEKDCHMCKNKVPEEGIVLRVEKLNTFEAYKLKSKRFVLMESNAQEENIANLEDADV